MDSLIISNSGFTSKRINLSPFTKDFRGVEQLNESVVISYRPTYVGHTNVHYIRSHPKLGNQCTSLM